MNKFLVFAIIFFGMKLNAQEKFTTYRNILSSKPIDISISYTNDSTYFLLVDMYSNDKINKKGGIWINSQDHKEFIDKILIAKSKYAEWINVAKQNKVNEMFKDMDINYRVASAYFYYGKKITQQMGVDLKFSFSVIGQNKSLLIRTGQLTSMTNEYLIHDGFKFVFTSEKEISDFIDKISVQKVKDFIKKPKTSDLFKN